jgi:hypothetical protein
MRQNFIFSEYTKQLVQTRKELLERILELEKLRGAVHLAEAAKQVGSTKGHAR